MENDNSTFSDIWGKMNEERKLEQTEREVRYADRRNAKMKNRESIERAAVKLCGAIEAALEEEHSPNTLQHSRRRWAA